MSKNYDDYDYENEDNGSNSGLLKKLLIVLLVVIAIIIVVYLLKGCNRNENGGETPKPIVNTEKEDALIEGARKYFDDNMEEVPTTAGECTTVTLETLINQNYVEGSLFATCETTGTYVNVCMLSNGSKQYTPWFNCSDKKSENEYGELVEGEISDVITNRTYVEFKFKPQLIGSTSKMLGSVEEMWKSDVKYSAYKTLSTTTYYRYRDKLYKWNITTNHYYSSNEGDNEYYLTSPNKDYQMYDNKAIGYKWYKEDYKLGSNGSREAFTTCPTDFPITGKIIYDTMYTTAVESSKYAPTLYYMCAAENSINSKYIIYTPYECNKRPVSQASMDEYKYQVGTIYSCAEVGDNAEGETILGKKRNSKTDYCYKTWNRPTYTKCDTSKNNCLALTKTKLQCYRKVYYNSNSTNASDEKIYYTTAPSSDAKKDESTKATVYKWYRTTTSTTTEYTATAPSGYASAKKSSDYKYSDWSNWSTTKTKATDGRTREFESKAKIKLQQIYSGGETEWVDLSVNYVSLDEMLTIFRNNNFKVNSLEDVNNNGEIRYQLQMFIRNKKETN